MNATGRERIVQAKIGSAIWIFPTGSDADGEATEAFDRGARCQPGRVRFREGIETKCFCTGDIGQPLLMKLAE